MSSIFLSCLWFLRRTLVGDFTYKEALLGLDNQCRLLYDTTSVRMSGKQAIFRMSGWVGKQYRDRLKCLYVVATSLLLLLLTCSAWLWLGGWVLLSKICILFSRSLYCVKYTQYIPTL